MALGSFQATVTDAAGNVVAYPTIQVWREIAGAPLATLFADFEGTTPLSNPFTPVSGDGYFRFHAVGGFYRVRASYGSVVREWRYVGVGLGASTDLTGLTPRGEWDALETYALGDLVTHDGDGGTVGFISLSEGNTGNEPDADTPEGDAFWMLAPAGAPGPQGETGVGLTPKGEWSGAVEYSAGDYVQHEGLTFVSLVDANKDNEPPSTAEDDEYWMWIPGGPEGPQGPPGAGGGGSNSVCDGRLTLASGQPIMTGNVTAAGTLYYTPHVGNRIALYDGVAWGTYEFAELSASLAGLTANLNYDVFVLDDGGLELALTGWSNDTTRATALARQDGVLVKSGIPEQRYLGTIRIAPAGGVCEWSPQPAAAAGGSHPRLFVWNAYNRQMVSAMVRDSGDSWTYTTATWRAKNNSANNRISFVVGESGAFVDARSSEMGYNAAVVTRQCGISLDSTTAPGGLRGSYNAADTGPMLASASFVVAAGFHYVQECEFSMATGTTYWYGDVGVPERYQSGMIANLEM